MIESARTAPLRRKLSVITALALAMLTLAACQPETATGSLILDVSGLPAGQDAIVAVNGTAGFATIVTESSTIGGLAFGEYEINAFDVAGPSETYRVVQVEPGQVTVTADSSPTVLVEYAVAPVSGNGQLVVAIDGLPSGTAADVSVTGPDGFSTIVTGTTVLDALAPGEYHLAAADLVDYVTLAESALTAEVKPNHAAYAEFAYTERLYLHVTAPDANLSLGASDTITFTLLRPDGATGPVTLKLTPTTGLAVSDTTLTFASGSNTVSTSIGDAGGAVDTYKVSFTAEMPDCAGCDIAEGSFEVTLSSMVVSTDDSDTPGTLRHLLGDERAETITFDPEVVSGGEFLINLAAPLLIDRQVTISGLDWSEEGPTVILDGQNALTPIIVDTGEVAAAVRLENLHIRNGLATLEAGGDGGGIRVLENSAVELSAVHVTRNEAEGSGGGIHNRGILTITDNSLILENHAMYDAGGIYNDGHATIVDSNVTENEAEGDGGGIYNGRMDSDELPDGSPKQLVISRSLIDRNSATNGAGIFSIRRLTVTDSELADNVAATNGGGINVAAMCSASAPLQNSGELHVSRSSFHSNGANNGLGGGLYASSQDFGLNSPLEIVNTTFAYNAATSGGGIYLVGVNDGPHSLHFNSIVRNYASGNHATDGVGAGLFILRNGIHLQGNLIAFNVAENTDNATQDVQADSGTVISDGHNFITTSPVHFTAVGSDEVNTVETAAPELQLAASTGRNGGPTTNVALGSDSSAARYVPAAECHDSAGEPLENDQRGMPRPVEGTCSVGAYQVQ